MARPRTNLLRGCLLSTCGLACLLLVGCRRDEIAEYPAPKEEKAPLDRPPRLLLGAIIPHKEQMWFFKLSGSPSKIAQHQDAFELLVGSVRFTGKDDEPITWTTPEGWQRERGPKDRYATLHLGPRGSAPELTVTKLPGKGDAASVLMNLNRWRGQVGFRPVNEEDLPKVSRQVKLDDGSIATLMSATGVAMPTPAGMERDRLVYRTPTGWKELPNQRPPRMAAFEVSSGGRMAEVTAISFPGRTGSLLQNVRYWGDQVGLANLTEEQMRKNLRDIEVDGKLVPYLSLVGPEMGGRPGQRLLSVSVEHEGRDWFFKMIGPADLVADQQSNFEEFVKSVRISGGTKDE